MRLDEIDDALSEASEADEALRAVVRLLASQPGIPWAGIAFIETTGLVLGPAEGTPDETRRKLATVCYKERPVGELRVDGDADDAFLATVADRISEHVLLGWDTGGEAWEP
jgi:hypothetical protein